MSQSNNVDVFQPEELEELDLEELAAVVGGIGVSIELVDCKELKSNLDKISEGLRNASSFIPGAHETYDMLDFEFQQRCKGQ